MSWDTSLLELRNLVSDGAADRLRYRKRVFGKIDGTNVTFKTFEFRRVTDLSAAVAPEGAYVDGVTAAVLSDVPIVGEFVLSVPPTDGQVVEATYYAYWFTDDEINMFMSSAAQWLSYITVDQIPPGLRPAALHYGAQAAYQKLSTKWAESISETYRLEDAPKDGAFEIVTKYQEAAKMMHDKSFQLRDDFYTRSGQALQPLFSSIAGRVSDPVPKR